MTKQPDHNPAPPKDRLDKMLDEPSLNNHFGVMTMREMVRKVILRRDYTVQEPKKIDLK